MILCIRKAEGYPLGLFYYLLLTCFSKTMNTLWVTSRTSWKSTTPAKRAKTVPPQADQPIDKFLGCQITQVHCVW